MQQICITCGVPKQIDEFYKCKKEDKTYHRKECKKCLYNRQFERQKIKSEQIDGYKQRLQSYKTNWSKRNKTQVKEINRNYYINNKSKIKEKRGPETRAISKRINKLYRDTLHPSYIKTLIPVSRDLVSPELILIKKNQLKLHRYVKQQSSK